MSEPRAPRFPMSAPRRAGGRRRRRTTTAAMLGAGLGAAIAIAGCDGSGGDVAALPPLLEVEQLGAGWIARDPGDVALLPGTIAPPCPFDGAIPDVDLAAADSIEFGDQERQLGINHTVVALAGDPGTADAVLATWEMMNCSGSDADQRPVDGLPDDVFGVELDTIDSDFTQAVLIRTDATTMSFLVVTGDGDAPIDLARDLAPLL